METLRSRSSERRTVKELLLGGICLIIAGTGAGCRRAIEYLDEPDQSVASADLNNFQLRDEGADISLDDAKTETDGNPPDGSVPDQSHDEYYADMTLAVAADADTDASQTDATSTDADTDALVSIDGQVLDFTIPPDLSYWIQPSRGIDIQCHPRAEITPSGQQTYQCQGTELHQIPPATTTSFIVATEAQGSDRYGLMVGLVPNAVGNFTSVAARDPTLLTQVPTDRSCPGGLPPAPPGEIVRCATAGPTNFTALEFLITTP